MNCGTCHASLPDDASFCGQCGTAVSAESPCAHCGRTNPTDMRFCLGCGRPRSKTANPARHDLRVYTPRHLADKILTSRASLEGERKQVTVLFADVKGSMALAEEVDPEEWHRILDRFFQILTDGVHRFEGTVNQYTGDGIMALFGAPIAHEDHAQRACCAALRLGEELQRYGQELKRERGMNFSVRIGLNSGEVVVGKIGDDLRMDYTAQGHTVGLAQRMEQLAEAGRPYLTAATAALVRGYFTLEDLGEFRVKGMSAPLRVSALEGTGALRTRLEVARARGFSKFVGRADETAALDAALDRALAGQGQVVGVVADAGTGKSRLCYEFAARCRARGIVVREAHGVAHGKMLPFLPVLEILRGFFEITEQDSAQVVRHKIAGALLLLDRTLEDTLPLLFDFLGVTDPDRPGPNLPPEERQRVLLGVMRKIIEARSARRPAVMLIEDLHWIDAGTEAFIETAVEAAARTRTLLLVNFRPEYHARWMQRAHYQQLPLLPLGPEAIDELLRDLLGAHDSLAGLAERIRERTAGNPFFIEEVVQALAGTGHLEGTRGAYRLGRPIDEIAIPATVQAVLAARIDRLAEREKAVLDAAAVIGKEFAEPVLARVVGAVSEPPLPQTDVAEILRALRQAEFLYEEALYPEAVYAFKHPLTQEVAYGSQLAERRARVHAAVARALEERGHGQGEQAALLAHHWEEAREPLLAARWHRRAAEWSGFTNVEHTFFHWGRVHALVRGLAPSAERDELATVSGLRLLWVGARLGTLGEDAEALVDEVTEAAQRVGSEMALAETRSVYAFHRLFTNGSPAEVVADLEWACDVLSRGDNMGAWLQATYGLAATYLGAGRYEQAVQLADTALARCQNDPSGYGGALGGPSTILYFLFFKATALAQLGRPDEADTVIDGLVSIAATDGTPVTQATAEHGETTRASMRGDAAAEVQHAIRALDLAERLGLRLSIALGALYLGIARCDEENWSVAIPVLERAYALHQERLFRNGEVLTLAYLAQARLGTGDVPGARAAADEALALAAQRGLWAGAVNAWVARARTRMHEGGAVNLSAIEQDLAAADALVVQTGERLAAPLILLARAELAERLGDRVARERHLREAQRLYVEMGATGHAEHISCQLSAVSPQPEEQGAE